ncbi:MAG: membrane biogenesis protein [Clostridia bacterium]|nr:membrane biogenesis protein [Clostridia bacterium]
MKFYDLFGSTKPVFGMLHLKSDAGMDALERAKREIDIYLHNGVEALMVENYFGSADECAQVLAWLQKNMPSAMYGVNILGDAPLAFELSLRYGAKFIQIDSVCGHLPPAADEKLARRLSELRAAVDVCLLGGVRFKYQPVRSGRTQEEDLVIGMQRCDAIVVTGDGTGMATPEEKIAQFRRTLGSYPLITGAGVTADTIASTLAVSDGVIVGSYLKDGHRDYGEVCEAHVRTFMEAKRAAC